MEIKNHTKRVFAPGCAMMLYKPELANKLHKILNEYLGGIKYITPAASTSLLSTPKQKSLTSARAAISGSEMIIRIQNQFQSGKFLPKVISFRFLITKEKQ